jgi:cytochrome c oxidase accessory protein FixG
LKPPERPARPVIPIAPSTDTSPIAPPPGASAALVSLYAAHQKIYPRSVSGLFSRLRWYMVFLTQLLFYGLPWLHWGERQAVLFDLAARRFYIFKLVLYPQDFIYLAGLLVICALSLFLFTAVAGRLWCGYACPQTVYTEIFMWIERHTEGDRSAHMRRDQASWTVEKFGRKAAKQVLWIAVGWWTGFTFVGYFTPIHVLAGEIAQFSLGSWEVFWVFFYGFATYGNAGYMREQVCKHMCPYARFQSAMFDKDTLIVSYDAARGEPRGARSKKVDLASSELGACVDCSLCVQVCPTGIDIRNGLQYECIGCGACADVCDEVMDKMHYPRGLVKYSTENAMHNQWGAAEIVHHVFRPRVMLYTTVVWTIIAIVGISLLARAPFKVDVERDRKSLARELAGGVIENVFRLQIMNVTEAELRVHVQVDGLPGLKVVTDEDLTVAPAQSRWFVLRLQLPPGQATPGSHPIHFEIDGQDDTTVLKEKAVFVVPH